MCCTRDRAAPPSLLGRRPAGLVAVGGGRPAARETTWPNEPSASATDATAALSPTTSSTTSRKVRAAAIISRAALWRCSTPSATVASTSASSSAVRLVVLAHRVVPTA